MSSPLFRRVLPVLAALLLLTLANAQPPNPPGPSSARADRERKAAALREQLATPIRFNGIDDPDVKIDDIFRYLERAYGIPFDVNAKAFKEDGVDEVLARPIGREIPKMNNVPLNTLLRKILDRVPVESGATWCVRGDAVEVTTMPAYHAEFYPGRPNGPFPPLVVTTFEKTPLEDALKQLAEDTEGNVVLDVRAAEKGKTPVTARLTNVPLDTAVLLLADMAGLKSVEVDGVYYVTSKENARALREDQAKSRPAKAEAPKPAKAEPTADDPVVPATVREEQIRRLKATIEGKPPPK